MESVLTYWYAGGAPLLTCKASMVYCLACAWLALFLVRPTK